MIYILQIVFDDGSSFTCDFDDFNSVCLYIDSIDYNYYMWDLKSLQITESFK